MSDFNYSEFDYILSIDIGNTYSGACYTSVKRTRGYKECDVSIVMDWPCQFGRPQQKIPTACLYQNNCAGLFKWGFPAVKYWRDPNRRKQNAQLVEKFKQKLTVKVETDGVFEITYTKAMIDYLKAIYQFAIQKVNDYSFHHDEVREDKLRFVLTVPEHWTDDDKHLFRLICIEAGLIKETDDEKRLHIIGECFASAIYCERSLLKSNTDELDNGTCFLICKAGGSTVNLGTYRCTGPNEKLDGLCSDYSLLEFSVEEDCGSELLDEEMKEFLLRIVFVNEEEREINKDIFGDILKTFNSVVKPNFCLDEESDDHGEESFDDGIYFSLNAVDLRNFKNSSASISRHFGPYEFESETFQVGTALKEMKEIEYLAFSKNELKEQVFDPVIDKTLGAIKRHIEKSNIPISTTFLLGGFGGSPYLQSRLQEKAKEFQTGKLIFDGKNSCETMIGALYYSHILGNSYNIE